MPTRQEIAARASEFSAKAARRRRFDRYAKEMAEHPGEIGEWAATRLAEALSDAGREVRVL